MHFINWMDWGRLVPMSLFGLVAAAAWCILDLLPSRRPRAEERLYEFKNPTIRRRGAEEPGKGKRSTAVTKAWAKASPALSKPVLPKSEGEAVKIRSKLAQAGFRGEAASGAYLSLKFTGLVIGLFFGGGGVMVALGLQQQAPGG